MSDAVRVCSLADIECFHGCGNGPCMREEEGRASTLTVVPLAHPLGGQGALWMAGEPARRIARLEEENAALRKATQLCDRHKPKGGTRPLCLVCAGEKLQSALSRISYACEEPNDIRCSSYDAHMSEDAVVDQVIALRKDAERYRWLRDNGMTGATLDAAIDAMRGEKPSE